MATTISWIPPLSRHFRLEQLAPGVWAAIQNDNYGHAICNAGIIDLGNKTIVFDPFMTPEAARDLKRAAEQLTGRQVALVINSHYHNDHIRGNQSFIPQAAIISTAWTRTKMLPSEKEEQEWEKKNAATYAIAEKEKLKKASGPEKKELIMWTGYYEGIAQSLPELKITLPDITFSDSLWIYGSKRNIKLVECRKGHTESDLVMLLPLEGIAFMGDLFFVTRHPYIGDGDAASWQKHIKHFIEDTSIHTYVPGHGSVAGKKEMQLMENYLIDIQNLVRKGIEQHVPDSVIVQQPVPAMYRQWWYSRFYKPNLQFLCKQVKR
ncbi:MAG: fold metallo-hydrolase [Chitinophagaceae bacterium]|nr:fold metallo-hydrolase [Chitinophagaceae bacterium]